jgi:polar amino acid transport system permease protein
MTTNGDGPVKVVPVRHYGRWAGGVVALIFIAMLVHTLFSKVPNGQTTCRTTNGVRSCHPTVNWRFSWNVVWHYFTSYQVLHGLVITLEITVLAMVIGIVLGVFLAVMRLSHSRLLSATAWSYTWFFRGTPVLVQLVFWFNIAALFPSLTLGVPFFHVTFLHLNDNAIFTPLFSGVVALGLNEAAYFSEITRSGLIAVDEGQTEAATSLGMSRGQTLRFVVLPQAMRVILPTTGNEVISMLKTSSLVSTAGVVELLGAVTNIYSVTYQVIPLLIVASIWYLIVTTVMSIGQFYLERHYAKGALRVPPPTPLQRIRRDVQGVLSKFRTRHGSTLEVTP